jgi:protein-S-isoprenylcysteine O-methyltransferase Ste14
MPEGADPTLRHDWPRWAWLAQAMGLLLFHGALPFGLSRLSIRHGWAGAGPSPWNFAGLLLVAAGLSVIVWVIALHRPEAQRHGWRIEKSPFEPTRYLITRGPYRYSRNPIYLSHLTIWIGWALFYGSVAIVLGALSLWISLTFIVIPYEERGLLRQLGEPYARYQSQVSRWFGRPSSPRSAP